MEKEPKSDTKKKEPGPGVPDLDQNSVPNDDSLREAMSLKRYKAKLISRTIITIVLGIVALLICESDQILTLIINLAGF